MSKQVLAIAEAVANEKDISQSDVLAALEIALAATVRRRESAPGSKIVVHVDPSTGEMTARREFLVVDVVSDKTNEIAQEKLVDNGYPELAIGEVLSVDLEPPTMTRVAAQTAKQVVVQRLRETQRQQSVESWKPKIGELVYGTVKRVNSAGVWAELSDQTEAFLPRREKIPREQWRAGQRIRALLANADVAQKGVPLTLSRNSNEYLEALMKIEIPEIGSGNILIKAISREPGYRAKVAIKPESHFRGDPVAACVGMRGTRIQTVMEELSGERVDIIMWDDNPAAFVVNSMAPAVIEKLVLDEENKTAMLAISTANQAKAIGKNGQNVRLANKLTGWTIKIMTPAELEEDKKQHRLSAVNEFSSALDVDEAFAEALYEGGFTTINEIAYVDLDELMDIEGIDAEIAEELKERAKEAILVKELSESVEESPLMQVPGVTDEIVSRLEKVGVNSVQDLADAATFELEPEFSSDEAGPLIMAARDLSPVEMD